MGEVGDQFLDETTIPTTSIQVDIRPVEDPDVATPYTHFFVGDTYQLDLIGQFTGNKRVVSITTSFTPGVGEYTVDFDKTSYTSDPMKGVVVAVQKLLDQFDELKSPPADLGGPTLQDHTHPKESMTSILVSHPDARDEVIRMSDFECDGVADHLEIQEAIDELTADGGTVWLSEGVFDIGATLTFPGGPTNPGIILRGMGWNTVLRITNSADIDAITFNEQNDIFLADFKIDGNRANQTAQGTGVDATEGAGQDSIGSRIERLWITEMDADGILIGSTTSQFIVRACRIDNCDNAGIRFFGSKNQIIGNNVIDCGTEGIFGDDDAGNGNVIADNIVDGCGSEGIITVMHGTTIVGNTSRNNLDGIVSAGTGGTATDNVIVGNVATDNSRYGIKLGNGVDGDSASNVVVGNLVTGNGTEAIRYGHTTGAKESIIQHNMGDTGGGTGPGTSPARSVEFSDQRAILVTGTGNQKWVAPIDVTIVDVQLAVGTSPTGADLVVDVNKNGTTIFTTQANRPTVPDGDADGVGAAASPDVTTMTPGEYLSVDIDQIGSTIAGGFLTVVIEWRPT